jgi:putative DNA-invertase from lambdoid prophage Rac
MKAANYHRVSTLDQNPTLAREELANAARARGFDVVMDVEETGSGARNDRPGLQRIMEAARKGVIQAVVVYKLDRFGRSALDVLANVQALTDAGVRFVAVTQGLDVQPKGDATSKLILTVLSGVAEFERELIRERTMTGIARARALGRVLGRPPLAAEKQAVIRGLWSQGVGAYSIAKQLGMKESTVRTYTRRFDREKGTTEPRDENGEK